MVYCLLRFTVEFVAKVFLQIFAYNADVHIEATRATKYISFVRYRYISGHAQSGQR